MEKIEQIVLFDENGDGVWIADLVRCKDCKYWTSNTQYCKLYSIGAMANRTPANWYCMGGERKEAKHK